MALTEDKLQRDIVKQYVHALDALAKDMELRIANVCIKWSIPRSVGVSMARNISAELYKVAARTIPEAEKAVSKAL